MGPDMIAPIYLFIPGRPKTKDRPRAGVSKGGKPFMYTTQKTANEEAIIRQFGTNTREELGWAEPYAGPIRLSACFLIAKPKRWYPGMEPASSYYGDIDNLLKTLKDGLNGTLYRDDGQVICYGSVRKAFWDYAGLLAIIELLPLVEPPPRVDKRKKAG